MKRHESLISLSRFHRSCLFLALIAKPKAPAIKGYPTEISAKISYALMFYQNELLPHFEIEERLWNYVAPKSKALTELIAVMTTERAQLNESFSVLADDQSEENLNSMGLLLETHIRKEERALFQQIQEDLSENELQQLSAIIA